MARVKLASKLCFGKPIKIALPNHHHRHSDTDIDLLVDSG